MYDVLKRTICLSFGLCLMCSLSGFIQEAGAEKKARWDVLPEEAKPLYKAWSDFMGQTSLEMVEANDPAPEIEPGTVITPENAASFLNLEKIMTPPQFKRISSRDTYAYFNKIEVVKTRPWYFSREHLTLMKENAKNCKIEPGTRQLLGWESSIPFPFPKNGVELMWNCQLGYIYFSPELAFEPFAIIDFDSDGKLERTRKANLYVLQIMGRTDNRLGEKHTMPGYKYGDIYEYGSLSFVYPQDMKGLAFVRTRYWDVDKPDRFVSYIPSMRRIRTLSGSDAQDPIAGSEYTWDMWGGEWQKQPSNKIFPNDYKMLGEKTILLPRIAHKNQLYLEGNQMPGLSKWEKRRVYVLEIIFRDPSYYYSKRIEYIDKETLKGLFFEYYDRRGELWRTWQCYNYFSDPGKGIWTYQGNDIVNWIDSRRTILQMNTTIDPKHVTPDYFNLKFLLRQVR